MVDVIELSSSSPLPQPPSHKRPPLKTLAQSSLPQRFDFDLDDFDETGSLDFEIDRPSKRQRKSTNLNPISQQKGPELAFEISSDHESSHEVYINAASASFSIEQTRTASIFDEITFSSSAPEPHNREKDVLDDLRGSDDDLRFSLSQPVAIDLLDEEYDLRTANLLAALTQDSSIEKAPKHRPAKAKAPQPKTKETCQAIQIDDIEFSSSPARVRPTKSSKFSASEKAAKAAERAAMRAGRDAGKEAEKERKLLERQRRAQEKQKAADLAEVNKSRINKKDSTTEMILDMSSSLKDTSVGIQVEEYMNKVAVSFNYIDEEINLTDNSVENDQYGSILTWRRKVRSKYNDEDDQWEPTSRSRVEKEKHVLVYLPAVEFASMVAASVSASTSMTTHTDTQMKTNLDAHVTSIRRRYPDCTPIYLIEGLGTWVKKNINAKNRAYTAAVRAQMQTTQVGVEASGSHARPRKSKKPVSESHDLSMVTSDLVDDLLLHLQIAHQPILIHHTTTPGATASQIFALTQHLSTRPYRIANLEYNLKSASFCMDSGQVRTGDDARDTFVKMLQEVQRVTPSMAYGIVEECNTVRKLVKGFDQHGNLMLEDVRKAVNKDGGWSDRRLGPMVSKRLYKVFMGRDPTATDGMS